MALASEDFDALIESMGLAGTAAANLEATMARLKAQTDATAAAEKVAAETGASVAQVRQAIAATNAAAEATERALAAEHKAAAQAAIDAANATAKLAAERTKAAVAAQKSAAKSDVDDFRRRQSLAENEKGFARQREETSKWFSDLTKSSGASTATLEDMKETVAGVTAEYAAAVAIATAYAAALYSLAESAVRLTQEKDALRDTFDVFTGGAGDALLDDLEELSAKLPYTADRLNAWAQSLLQAGIQGDALKTSIEAIAASAAITKTTGAAASGLIKRFALAAQTGQTITLDRRILNQLQEAGVLTKDLAAALGVAPEKLGGMKIAADKLGAAMQNALINKGAKSLAVVGQSWTSISAKLSEGWDDAFEDLGDIVGPFMAQLRSLASEFFAGSIAGGGFKDVIKGVLTPAFEVATRTVRAMHIAFLYAQIAYLKATIALKPLTDALNGVGVAGGIVNVAMYLIAGTAVILAVVLGVLALAVFLIILPFLVLAVAIYGVVKAVQYLIGVFSGAVANVDNLASAVQSGAGRIVGSITGMVSGAARSLLMLPVSAFQAGLAFISGLAQAIVSGQGPVADAVRSLAASAVGAIKGALGIASPSRVARQMGGFFTAGLEGGIDEGTGDVEGAAEGAGDAAAGGLGKGLRKAGRSGAGQGKGDRVFAPVFNNCVFGGGLTQEAVNDMMATWWEMQAAAGPEPEPT